MRVPILVWTMLATLLMSSTTVIGQSKEEADALRDGLVSNVRILADRLSEQPALVQDWLRNSEIVRATRSEFANSPVIKQSIDELARQISPQQLQDITSELARKTYTDLIVINLAVNDNNVCIVISCFGVEPTTVRRIADAVTKGRDKEESVRSANINSTIAISGAVVAVFSFAMSAWSTTASLRSKKK